jgi:hypothetical protein
MIKLVTGTMASGMSFMQPYCEHVDVHQVISFDENGAWSERWRCRGCCLAVDGVAMESKRSGPRPSFFFPD